MYKGIPLAAEFKSDWKQGDLFEGYIATPMIMAMGAEGSERILEMFRVRREQGLMLRKKEMGTQE